MRILAFSDLHSSYTAINRILKMARKADVLVCAGDFTNFEEGMRSVLQKLNATKKPVILVHGNHEDPAKVRKLCARLKNIHYIHKKSYKMGDYAFIGHGGEGFALTSRNFEKFAGKLRTKKGEKIIFVTHQPPHRTKLDYIWAHHGNKSYRKFIERRKPVLAVCGHLHETAGMKDRIGKTLIVNAGEKGMLIEL